MYAKSVEDLRIYVKALQLSKEINELIKKIPYNWKIKEASQIKRSSSSVSPNIAEGFGQRFYVKKFLYYLNIALGSSDETQSHLIELYNKKHLKKAEFDHYFFHYKKLSVQILNFINDRRNKLKI